MSEANAVRYPLKQGIIATLKNAERLAEEARDLGECGRTQTAFFLSVLAREEFAKAFLLVVSEEEALPWNTRFQAALRSHRCKQLVSHIICELSAKDLFDSEHLGNWPRRVQELPSSVVDAFNILMHEHLSDLERADWWYKDEDPPVDPTVHELGAGALERRKQDSMYVRFGWNGAPRNDPTQPLPKSTWEKEYGRLQLMRDSFWTSEGKLSGSPMAQYPLISALIRVLVGTLSPEEYERDWA